MNNRHPGPCHGFRPSGSFTLLVIRFDPAGIVLAMPHGDPLADRPSGSRRVPDPAGPDPAATVPGLPRLLARGPGADLHLRQHRRAARAASRGATGRRPGQVRRPRTRRLLLRARRAVRGRGAVGVRGRAPVGTGRWPGPGAPHALRGGRCHRRREVAGTTGFRDEPAMPDPAGRRRRRRSRRLAVPGPRGAGGLGPGLDPRSTGSCAAASWTPGWTSWRYH